MYLNLFKMYALKRFEFCDSAESALYMLKFLYHSPRSSCVLFIREPVNTQTNVDTIQQDRLFV